MMKNKWTEGRFAPHVASLDGALLTTKCIQGLFNVNILGVLSQHVKSFVTVGTNNAKMSRRAVKLN